MVLYSRDYCTSLGKHKFIRLLKQAGPGIVKPLLHLINLSITQAIFPDKSRSRSFVMKKVHELTMTHYWCEFGSSALICSDIIAWTRLCKVVHLSVKVQNDLNSQGQGHSYWIEVICLRWYKMSVNLATLHSSVQKLLLQTRFCKRLHSSVKVHNHLEGQGQDHAYQIEIISPPLYTNFLATLRWSIRKLLCRQGHEWGTLIS